MMLSIKFLISKILNLYIFYHKKKRKKMLFNENLTKTINSHEIDSVNLHITK